MKLVLAPLLLAGTLGLLTSPAQAAFQCPAADTSAASGRPMLSDADVRESTAIVPEHVKVVARQMLAAGTRSGDVVDKLVVADCRRVETEASLSDEAKADRVRHFAARLAHFVYSTGTTNEEDVVLDIPVPTSLYEQLHRSALKLGVSEDVWIIQAIGEKLGKP